MLISILWLISIYFFKLQFCDNFPNATLFFWIYILEKPFFEYFRNFYKIFMEMKEKWYRMGTVIFVKKCVHFNFSSNFIFFFSFLFLNISSAHYSPKDRRFSRSGSVPNLSSCNRSPTIAKQNSISPTAQRIRQHHRTSKKDRIARNIRSMQRNNLNKSIDEGGVYFAKKSIDSQNSTGKYIKKKTN